MKKDDKINSSSFTAGQFSAAKNHNLSSATDMMVKGMDEMLDEWNRAGANSNKHGFLFEFIEKAKFNTDAVKKNKPYRNILTSNSTDANVEQNPHAEADGVIMDGNQKIKEIQYKSNKSAVNSANEIRSAKYKGMDRVVPSDKVNRVEELVNKRANSESVYADNYKDAHKNLKGETKYKDVSSDGTTYEESINAKKNPYSYANKLKIKQAGSEMLSSAAYGAVAGAIIGGGISVAQKLFNHSNNTKEDNIKEVINDAKKSGVKGGVIGGSGALLRFISKDILNSKLLSKANVSTALAAGLLNTGTIIYKFTKGNIDSEQAMKSIGQTGFSCSYGIYMGSAITTVISGPMAAAIATTAGYFIANFAYQSTMAILKGAKLAKKEALIIENISNEACKKMKNFREDFQNDLERYLVKKEQVFNALFKNIDNYINRENYYGATEALACFAGSYGKVLKLSQFDDFDEFMSDNTTKLVI